MMVLYSRLEDVPLPQEEIYNGPLDEKIVPLVKAIQPFAVSTIGSCQGHFDHFFPYPWVQLNPYDDTRLLEYLVDKSNDRTRSAVSWKFNGNILRTERKAKDISELKTLQDSVISLSQFLFEYRPEVLDSSYCGDVVSIPPSNDPVYDEIDRTINRLLDESITIGKREIDHPEDISLGNSFREKIIQLQELHEIERTYVIQHGDQIILPVSAEQVDHWLELAKKILG